MKISFLFVLAVFISSTLLTQTASYFKKSVYFETGKSELDSTAFLTLNVILDSLDNYSVYKIIIRGNTDSIGDTNYNSKLSVDRCNVVSSFLLLHNINRNSLVINAYGERKPLDDNSTEAGRQKNRRVDIIVSNIKRKSTPAIIQKDSTVATIKDLFLKTNRKFEEFCIDPEKDTLIRCAYGSLIYIRGGTINYDFKNKKCVTIRVKEEFLKSDMILDNISTTSSGKIIETQGMVYVEARQGNKILSMKPFNDYTVMTPTENNALEYDVFNGEEFHDALNWTVNNNSILWNFTVADIFNCWEPFCSTFNPGCPRCKYLFNQPNDFFCRIRRVDEGFVGIFDKNQHEVNIAFRQCQKNHRRDSRTARKSQRNFNKYSKANTKSSKKIIISETIDSNKIQINSIDTTIALDDFRVTRSSYGSSCQKLDSIFKTYGLTDLTQLVYAVNRPLLEKYNVSTLAELEKALYKDQINSIELNYLNKSIAFEDYKYYIYNSSKFGWSNVDKFTNEPNLVDVGVNLSPDEFTDCKLVFKNRRAVVPATVKNELYIFENIPADEEVWIVALRYINGIPLLSLENIITSNKFYPVNFQAYSLPELKEKLKLLDTW